MPLARPTDRRFVWRPDWDTLLRRGVFSPAASRDGRYSGVVVGATLAPRTYGTRPAAAAAAPPGPRAALGAKTTTHTLAPTPAPATSAATSAATAATAVPPRQQFLNAWGQLELLGAMTPLVCVSSPTICAPMCISVVGSTIWGPLEIGGVIVGRRYSGEL